MFGKKKKQQQEVIVEPVSTGKKVKKAGKNTLFWVLSVFLIVSGLAFMPSITSILFFAAGALILPIGKLQEGLKKIFPKKALKGGLCGLLVFVAMLTVPTDTTPATDPADTTTPPAYEQQIDADQQEQDTAAADQQEQKPPVEETKTPEETPPPEDQQIITPPEATEIPENSTFEVHYIDVGQADAALVLCDGKAMLIDGGNSEDSSLIYSYLKNNNVSHLDYIVATHGHEDHVGGLSGALNYATIGTAYCSVSSYDTEAFKDFVKYLDKQGKEITIPKAGDSFKLGSASVQIVAVNGNAADHNDASIILRIVYGDTSFLFTGDAEREAEQAALKSGYELESTVLKVGHHGSKNATEYVFLRQVAPEYAVISVGKGNTYGHPTEDALSRLRDADVKTYRTDLQGTIICESDGKEVSFTVSRNKDADTLAPPQEQQKPVVETPPVVVPPVEDNTDDDTTEQEPVGTDYVGNKNSKKFHYDWCSSVGKMKESNKYYYTGTREEMIAKGYEPCGNCHP